MTKFFTPPSQPLTGSDIHIWFASLSASVEDLSHYASLLSQDEIARAGRFYFEKDRNHFIVARGLLRTILVNYLDVDPPQIEFVYGQYGKPAIKSDLHKQVLEFNLAHSQDMAVYAFSLDRRIGIDIEYVKSLPTMDEFAGQYFSFQENMYLNSLSGKQKEETFFKIWTCKEAFLKANGSGLTIPVNQVEIFIENDGAVVLLSVGKGEEQAAIWRLEVFSPIPGYQAALAVEGHGGKVIFQNLKSGPPNE